jgi:hypothetical protein
MKNIKRRDFLKKAGVATVVSTSCMYDLRKLMVISAEVYGCIFDHAYLLK